MLALAFNCVPLNAVPYVMLAGLFHVTTGAALLTVTLTFALAVV
jgi:hypothetical protein